MSSSARPDRQLPNAGVQRTHTAAWVGGCAAAAVGVRCNDSLDSASHCSNKGCSARTNLPSASLFGESALLDRIP